MTYSLQWRQNTEKMEAWLTCRSRVRDGCAKGVLSRRNVAQLCGRILWRFGLTRLPLCELSDVIAIIRKIAKGTNWGDAAPLTHHEFASLLLHLDRLQENAWIDYAAEPERRTMTACSDSSLKGWGYVIFTAEKPIERGFAWSNMEEHIFLKELIAACRTIEHCININNGKPTEVRIGIDNSAAAHAIRNLHSSSPHAEQQLRRLWQTLSSTKSTVRVVSLLSAENAADEASRGRRASAMKMKECCQKIALEQVECALDGLRLNTYDPSSQPAFNGRVRHTDGHEKDLAVEALVSYMLDSAEKELYSEPGVGENPMSW